MHRSRLRLVLAASVACLLVLAAPRARADGPVMPVPVAVKPTWVLLHLVESGVRIPREQAMAALQAYVDGLEQATVQAIDAGKGALSGSVDDVRRRQELANRASDAATRRMRSDTYDSTVPNMVEWPSMWRPKPPSAFWWLVR